MNARLLDRSGLDAVIRQLAGDGRRVLGPRERDGGIVYAEIAGEADLARGVIDEQAPGAYRLVPDPEGRAFAYTLGSSTWKSALFPPRQRLWSGDRSGTAFTIVPEPAPQERLAFIGVRACEIKAIAIQDKVFLQGPYVDPHYNARRKDLFLVAVNCGTAGGTCFCASMNTGPRAASGFDLALTEFPGEPHEFLVQPGNDIAAMMVSLLPQRAATAADIARAAGVTERTAAAMGRHMQADGVHDLLLGNLEHKRWDDVAGRCLSCGNCTQVCPTCFCTALSDVNDLSGATERTRRWDSCFSVDFSYIHGGSVRPSPRSRYRQWMTHKLASWEDQFGTSGCVGCGRCITWCPVGIDITEEVRAIREGGINGNP